MKIMTKRLLTIVALTASLMVAPSATSAVSPRPENIITTDGITGVQVGMSKNQLTGRIGAGTASTNDSYQCNIYPLAFIPDASVMIERGVVTSVIVHSTKARTASGARVGMTAKQLQAIYGRKLQKTEHTYQDAPAAYYTIRSTSGRKVVFDVGESGRVAEIRAGRSADYVEGCL